MFAAVCAGAVISACAEPEQPGADPTGAGWELRSGSVDGASLPIVDGYPITLAFADDTTAGGTAACNGYGASYDVSGSGITFSELIWTEMGCTPELIMESEQTYLGALPRVMTFSLADDRLTLTGEDVELVFDALPPVPAAELSGTVWVLDSLVQGDSVSSVLGERATLELFTDGSMLGSTGCRNIHGSYTVGGADVVVGLTVDGDCPEEPKDQHNHVITVLDKFRAEVDGETLTITTPHGQGLVYRAEG